MTMKTNLLFLYTESALHIGMGSSISAVDLPIQRERITGHPIVPGSGLKGALRSQANCDEDKKAIIFGPDPEENKAHEHAGAITVSDAHVVLFPVRALNGVFAYITCPLALARLSRNLQLAGVMPDWQIPEIKDVHALVNQQSKVTVNNNVVLEEFTFTATPPAGANADAIASWLAENALPDGPEYGFWRKKVQDSLVILPDNDFRDFVLNSTEISTHVRLDPNTKTVKSGALWTEEALPSDVLLSSLIIARRSRKEDDNTDAQTISNWLRDALPMRLQIGGNETTGQGLVVQRWVEGAQS